MPPTTTAPGSGGDTRGGPRRRATQTARLAAACALAAALPAPGQAVQIYDHWPCPFPGRIEVLPYPEKKEDKKPELKPDLKDDRAAQEARRLAEIYDRLRAGGARFELD